MSTVYFIFKVILMCCLVNTLSASREEVAQDFIERVLKLRNPDRVLNSVLGRLERNRQGHVQSAHQRSLDEEDCEEPKSLPEYTEPLKESIERDLGRSGTRKHNRLCPIIPVVRDLNTDEYEFRPAHYEEIRCNRTYVGNEDEMCLALGLSCVEWTKTIHLIRRRYTSDCWEPTTMVVKTGCECMFLEEVSERGDNTYE